MKPLAWMDRMIGNPHWNAVFMAEHDLQEIGEALLAAIREADLTVPAVADSLGWPVDQLRRVITGDHDLTVRELSALCFTLGISVELGCEVEAEDDDEDSE